MRKALELFILLFAFTMIAQALKLKESATLSCTQTGSCTPTGGTTVSAEEHIVWDFKNIVQTGSVYTTQGVSTNPHATGFISQTGGFRAGETWAYIVEYFGATNYPFLQFTTTMPIRLDQVSFSHLHNHNYYFNAQGYTVTLQLDSGSGFTDVGSFTASQSTNYQTATINLGGKVLQPGTYKIRWIGTMNYGAADTNSDWFAFLSLDLKFTTIGQPAFTTAAQIVWDFKNAHQGTDNGRTVELSEGTSSTPQASGLVSQSGGFRNEYWSYIVEFFGQANYPYLQLTTKVPVKLKQVSFQHLHNHNYYMNWNGYDVAVQLDTGSGYTTVGTFRASQSTNYQTATIDLGSRVLQAGTYKIRWVPVPLDYGAADTNTDWFALLALTLTFNI